MTRNLFALAAVAAFLAGSAPADANHCATHSSSSKSAGYGKSDRASIVETAVAAGSFQTLTTALQEAGLVEALSGKGPFTVFAPTDEAFAKLPKGTVEELLKEENRERLVSVLTYHVAAAKLKADKVTATSGTETLNGQKLEFTTKDDAVMVNGARVVKADILCSNGVIHVIDTVLLPEEGDEMAMATHESTR